MTKPTPTLSPEPAAYKVSEVAAKLHVSPSHLYNLIRDDKLDAFRVGTAWRIPAAEVDRLQGGNGKP